MEVGTFAGLRIVCYLAQPRVPWEDLATISCCRSSAYCRFDVFVLARHWQVGQIALAN